MNTHDGLERGYRRLLAVYPWQHRRSYEEEMVGVLLSEAEPGQRRPRPAEVADLLAAATAARFRGAAGGLRDEAWRQAASVVVYFGAILMLGVSLRPLLNEAAARISFDARGLDSTTVYASGFVLDVESLLRPALWALVVAALVLHRRRFAAGAAAVLAVLAATAEITRVAGWYAESPSRVLQSFWLVTGATLIAVAAVWLIGGVPGSQTRGALPRGTALVVVAVVLILAGGVADIAQRWWFSDWSFVMTTDGGFMVRIAALLFLAAAVLLMIAGALQGAPVRRRLVVFGLPVAVVALMVPYGFAGFMFSSQQFATPIPVNPLQWTLLIGGPAVTFVVAALALQRRERHLRWIALGQAADGSVKAP
jgi:hypothetical protein